MYKSAFLLLILSVLLTSCSNAKPHDMLFFGENVQPKLKWNGLKPDESKINDFQTLFLKATGQKIELIDAESTNSPIIALKIEKSNSNQFKISFENKILQIEGSSAENLSQGIHYFFLNCIGYYPFKNTEIKVKEFWIPSDLNYLQQTNFEYREPYFQQNYQQTLSDFNHTNQLEESWGIWGHQLANLSKENIEFAAEIKGVKTKEQVCFSNKSLEKEIIKIIQSKNKENSNLKKFMLMPADNNLVCECSACIQNGNSKNDASPAVFKLINKLAQKFPEYQFFGSAYGSTQKPPAFLLEKNAGVMLSTMAFPKGIVYEKSKFKTVIDKTITDWKAVSQMLYVWDYAIHFDLYLSSYPSLLIHQQNLKFFENRGIKGIFMQGNEEGYAAFEDLKYFIYSQLLLNQDVDVQRLIRFYLEGQYPKSGKILTEYFLEIESRAFNSKYEMDIYGGWKQQIQKYLSYQPLQDLIQNLTKLEPSSSQEELSNLKNLKIALNYQLLELLRIQGIGEAGYATINSASEVTIAPEVAESIKQIQKLQKESKLEIINEQHVLLSNYLNLWNSEVFERDFKAPILNLKIHVKSKLDEDYADLSILNTGKIAFNDYDNNWLITTTQPLVIEIESHEILKAKTCSISFLQDTKHRIYFPKAVKLKIGKEIYSLEIPENVLENSWLKYTVEIPIKPIQPNDSVSLELIKQAEFKDKSNACGELQFTKR